MRITGGKTVRAIKIVIFVACLAGTGQAWGDDAGSPEQLVETLHTTLIEAMQGGTQLGHAGRVALFAPVVEASFDFAMISRIVAGRYWKDASAEQQARFTTAFAALSTATYAHNFSSFDNERFATVRSEDQRGGKLVLTELTTGDGSKVSLNYLLRQNNGRWRIVNVIAQGVSDLALKRADYTAVIKAEGFDSLINKLAEKTAGLVAGS